MKKHLCLVICGFLSAAVLAAPSFPTAGTYLPLPDAPAESAASEGAGAGLLQAYEETAYTYSGEVADAGTALDAKADAAYENAEYSLNAADEYEVLANMAIGVKADHYAEEPSGLHQSGIVDWINPFLSYNTPQSAQRNKDFGFRILRRNIDTAAKKVTVEAMVTNNTAGNGQPVIFSAVYADDGALKRLDKKEAVVNAGAQVFVKFEMSIEGLESGRYTHKFFLWDGSMRVLGDAVVFESGPFSDTSKTLTLNQKAMSLRLTDGQNTGLLTAEIYPEEFGGLTVNFESSNPAVATVDRDGVVSAVSYGSAYIIATTSDYGAMNKCLVTVAGALTTDIALNQSAVNMWQGASYVLRASLTPADSEDVVVWSSSQPGVASVSGNGIVTGLKKGTAEIEAKVGSVYKKCTVNVYIESDYTGTVAAKYESNDNPASISGGGGDSGGKSYGCFQFTSAYNVPKTFYNWLITTGFNTNIGTRLKSAHEADGGADYSFGSNFDWIWNTIAGENAAEFRSCQYAYAKTQYYDAIYQLLKNPVESDGLEFNPDNYGIALKNALWSRAIQHGTSGAFNVVKRAFEAIGGFQGKTERELVAAIYAESGGLVDSPPGSSAIKINDGTQTAVKYGLVGKYMKYFSLNASSIQVGVWVRLNIDEPNMIYALIDKPPVVITPQN